MSLGRCALVALGLAALSVAPPGRAAETLPPPPPPVPAPAGLEPTAPAPAAPATDAEVDADAAPPFDPFEYAILPVVSYDADSGAGAALLGLFYWNDPNIEPYRDHLLVFSYITTKLVQIHGLGWEHIGLFGKPKVRLRIGSTFTITSNDHYCGVGNEADCSKARARELLTADGLDPTSREFEHALDHFYKVRDLIPTVGFDLRWPVSSKVPDLLAFFGWRGTWLIPGQVGARGPFAHSLLARSTPDGEKGLLSAVEVGLLHQRRDEERQPTRGHVLSLSLRGSTRALGSDWDYAGFNLTFTGYVPLDRRGKLVFAARGVLDFMVGDGSVYTLSTVGGLFTQRGYGGKSLGRGIRQARYIGRIKGIGRAELRWTMFGRPGRFQLGSHTFIDLGWIGYDWGDFRGDRRRLLPGFGGGLTATWRKNFLVRLDAATSAFEDWAPSFYLNLTHPLLMRRDPGFESERMIVGLEGGVERRADHDILRWPALPMAAEGNMLVYDRPPEPSDLPAWEASFRRAMALWPDVRHLAFGWGGRPPDDAGMVALEARGYRLETVSVRLAEALALAPPAPVGIRVRPLQSRAEWGLAVDLQLDATPEGETLPDYADFAQARMERCAALCQRGFGFWLGAFEGSRLAGCLGVFARRGLGRYQMVVTGSAFRRRGVAGHLVGAAATRAIRTLGARRLVICAEPGSPADALYGRLGFRPVAPMHRAIRCADD